MRSLTSGIYKKDRMLSEAVRRKAIEYVSSHLGPRTVFSISGVTATGKTELALALAEYIFLSDTKFNRVDIISADSRQVYADIPIVSGADIPAEFTPNSEQPLEYPFFSNSSGVHIHGVSILDASEEWSVAHFQHFALPIIEYSWRNRGVVLVVGGTGLYHAHLFNTELQTQPGPDVSLRAELETLSVEEMQGQLQNLSPEKWQSMNESDQANPRRLVRAIEQLTSSKIDSQTVSIMQSREHRTILLDLDLERVAERISARVHARLEAGAIQEVQELFERLEMDGSDLKVCQVLSATGVKEIALYLEENLSLAEMTSLWITRERKYAKSQQTWWKSHRVDFKIELASN